MTKKAKILHMWTKIVSSF